MLIKNNESYLSFLFYFVMFIYNFIVSIKLLIFLKKIQQQNNKLIRIIPFFATTLNFIVQQLYFMFRFVFEIIEYKNSEFFFYLYFGMIGPASVFVCFCYWVLVNIDENLINFSDKISLTKLCPKILNHCLHTFIIIPIFLEFFFLKFPTNPKWYIILTLRIFTNLTYILIVFVNKFINNIWIYGILQNESTRIKIMIVTSSFWYLINQFFDITIN